jgi:hypothetical protein
MGHEVTRAPLVRAGPSLLVFPSAAAPLAAVALLALACACGADVPPRADAGSPDATALLDAGDDDAGPVDAARRDADAGEPDAGEQDRDGDGLLDAEDPDPANPNPQLFRDAFTDLSGGWIFSSVSMGIATERGLLEVQALEPFEREGWIGPRPSWGDYLARTRLRIEAIDDALDPRIGQVGLIARVEQVTPNRYLTCELDARGGRVILTEQEGSRLTVLASAPISTVLGAWLELRFEALGTGLRCRVGGVEVRGASTRRLSGAVGFRSFGARFAADWLEVFAL